MVKKVKLSWRAAMSMRNVGRLFLASFHTCRVHLLVFLGAAVLLLHGGEPQW